MKAFLSGLTLLFCFLASQTNAEQPGRPATADQDGVDYFETHVRPLLHAACSGCHGEKKQWGSLRLDSRDHLLTGGDSGPAIVPGDPEHSLLISAVRRDGDFEMPPEKPLTPDQVAILTRWVQMGAPWPKETPRGGSRGELFRNHWAFQPLSHPTVPQLQHPEWCQTPVDFFVLEKLQQADLSPAPKVDRRTLIRRVTYDLTGLPPKPEEVAAFEQDTAPDAYAKLVNRLLDSPQYGEHWGRMWLDLARYADTKGYVYGREERRFVHSWTYRDWVVNAFNSDLPYDRFLALQLAADQLAPDDDAAQAAMGFLTIGRRFLGNSHDIIDDQIDVLGRTTIGLSIACARCHDHKYDPIPTADYYSLYGVFQNSSREMVPLTKVDETGDAAYFSGLHERAQKFKQGMETKASESEQRVRGRIADYLFAQSELDKYPDVSFSQILTINDIIPSYVLRWEAFLRGSKKSQEPIFSAWHLFAAVPKDEFSQQTEQITHRIQNSDGITVLPRVAALFTTTPASLRDVADRYGQLFQQIDQQWKEQLKQAADAGQPVPVGLTDPEAEQLRSVLYGPTAPCTLPDHSIVGTEFFLDLGSTTEMWALQSDLDHWLIDQAAAPPYTVRMVDRSVMEEPRIFRRGNPATKTEEVPRQLPLVLGGPGRKPFQHGSGRLELAQGIIDPANPLTARVWVNRIWQHHFGTGIVATPSDFGTRAPRPEHLALLDWLAETLMKDGWSTKAIQRQIVLSAAYQQAAGPSDQIALQRTMQVDPENQLIWGRRAHRLTFEEIRDSMLAASGELDFSQKGRGVPLFTTTDGQNHRRSIYGYVDRQFLPSVFRVFDFANPDLHIPTRSETTVSQQALFMLNNPFVGQRARHLVTRIDPADSLPVTDRIHKMFEQIYQREPTAIEQQAAEVFLQGAAETDAPVFTARQLAWEYGYGTVNSAGTAVENFQKLPHFTGTAWQGGEVLPDGKLGWLQMTAEGGHPGNDEAHALVRRWTAGIAGTVSIDSQARHEVEAGNGIRCWIISSRNGLLNQFTIHNSNQNLNIAAVAVQPGDTVDFVVDINGQLNSDQHLWEITIEEVPAVAGTAADSTTARRWNSKQDFVGPQTQQLKPWEQLAQVLFLSNEFLFVD